MTEEALRTAQAGTNVTLEISEFESLLWEAFKPSDEWQKGQIAESVHTLAEQALDTQVTASADVLLTIQEIVAAIDATLTEQVNLILHHESFQKVESAWRGLDYLINNTETDEMLKIRVMSISKNDLHKTLKKYKGAVWDRSPIFKKLYKEQYEQFGGEPYGCLVGDYYFDHSAPDVELLGEVAKISASIHAPFISGASPATMLMDSWQELANSHDLTRIFQTPTHAAWRSLRDREDTRYVALTLPRFLARTPYGAKTDPVDEFDFEENAEGMDSSFYCWANSAYPMAANITRAFKLYGWCSRIRGIESGGLVEGLPAYAFPTDDDGVDIRCATEIAISGQRVTELTRNGLMPLVHTQNSEFAAFIDAQSLHRPFEFEDLDLTADARLAARLPYVLATCRFAHYLKCIVRDNIGRLKDREDMERSLNNWIVHYVDESQESETEQDKAARPLAAAAVKVEEVEGDPGYYMSKFFLRPHYQLEGLTVSLCLVSKLPSTTIQ